MTTEQPRYRSYLLRLWVVRTAERTTWRASLEDPHTGDRLGFANLEQLFAYLEAQTGAGTQPKNEPTAAR